MCSLLELIWTFVWPGYNYTDNVALLWKEQNSCRMCYGTEDGRQEEEATKRHEAWPAFFVAKGQSSES